MIDIAKLKYREYAILPDGRRLNITGAVTAASWSEGEGEISKRLTMTVANTTFEGKPLSSTIAPNTLVIITADAGAGEKETARGYVVDWGPTRSSGGKSFTVTAYDEMFNLQQSQDDRYLPAGTGTKSAISAVFTDWGIPVGEYKGPDTVHAKTIFKAQYLSDIILTLLDDAEKHGADHYIVGSEAGKAFVRPIGSNEDVYHFAGDSNTTTASDKISTSSLVTRVKVMGLEDAEGKSAPEAIVDGLTEYGIRQRIYNRSADDTLESAKAAAQAIIDDEGKPERNSTVVSPDVPFMHKGDKVHLDTETLNGYFIVKSVNHDVTNRSMTLSVVPHEGLGQTSQQGSGQASEEKKDYAVGDTVQFNGGSHYVSSTASSPASTGLGAGPAKITYTNPGAAHPWHLVTQDWSKTHVYGWVDDGTFS